ncbi:hypothetical protein [Streptomyces sp. NPDC048606]|uniref:hypothetical protein n=1 Tax=Streptomyces sp. NPDC048606 TaxID=3154726 RepID=UPI003419AADF
MKTSVSASEATLPRQSSMFWELLDTRESVPGSSKRGCAFCTLCIAVAHRSRSPHRKAGSPIR